MTNYLKYPAYDVSTQNDLRTLSHVGLMVHRQLHSYKLCCQTGLTWSTNEKKTAMKKKLLRLYFALVSWGCGPYEREGSSYMTQNVVISRWKLESDCVIFSPWVMLIRFDESGTWCMMTSSNGYIFRVTGLLCGEFTGHRWIPFTKASDAELWCCLWSAPEQTFE